MFTAVALVRGAARAIQHPPIAATIGAVTILAFLTRHAWYPRIKHKIEEVSPGIREAGVKFGRFLLDGAEQHLAALTVWSSAQRGHAGGTFTHRIARILATSPAPMTRTEVTARLRDDVAQHGHRKVMYGLYAVLNKHQAFCEISRGRWQLGKENANFGGLASTTGEDGYNHEPATPMTHDALAL